jgi:hypothetical protein
MTARTSHRGAPPAPGTPARRAACFGAAIGTLAAALSGIAPARAAPDAAPLTLELNRLEAREGGACRIWMVTRNGAAEALDPLRLDLVMFGRDGVILRRLAVDLGPLPAGRTAVRIFDVGGQACDGIGQLLLNDVLACGGTEPARREACAEGLALRSRAAGVEFQK